MQPTSLYPNDNPFVIQRVMIPQKGRYKFTVPEGYEMVVCDGNKEAECLGSGRQVEIKGRRQPPGELYWIPLKPQTISYLKGDRKILIVVRFFDSTQLISNRTSSLDLRTMLKPLTTHIDRLIAEHTTAHGLRKSIGAAAHDMVEPMGVKIVEVKIEQMERRS